MPLRVIYKIFCFSGKIRIFEKFKNFHLFYNFLTKIKLEIIEPYFVLFRNYDSYSLTCASSDQIFLLWVQVLSK